jgi:hypothetical protein
MKQATAWAILGFLLAVAGSQASSTVNISTQPADQTVGVGAKLEFYVSATTSTTNALSYQWYKKAAGGTAGTTGSNSSTNTVASAAAGDEAAYWVVITDVTSTNTSATNKVQVIAAPSITASPANKTVGLGSNYTFTVACSNRLGSFFWYFNATNLLNGGASNSYPIRGAKAGDAGTYTLVLTNLAGAATSTPALLSVVKYPTITNQPAASNVVPAGVNVTNTVGVDGTGLAYQWYLGKTAAASTSNTLIITGAAVKDSGTYTVVITNAVGKVTSAKSILTVIPPPAIGTQPAAPKTALAVGQRLTLTVKATGMKPYTNLVYQWVVNGTNALNTSNNATATKATLVISNTATTDSGAYAVVITNFGGAVTSTPVAITVGADTKVPVLKITDPGKTNAVATNASYNLKGTATDEVAVTNVAFSLDGINFTNRATTTNLWAKWTADVPLKIGSNDVWVVAADYSGNKTTNKLKIFYAKWYTLTITNAGTGSGIFVGANNAVQYGSNYVVTAKPSLHHRFVKWVNWSGVTLSTNGTTNTWQSTTNVIKFLATNDATLTVEIDTNRFWNSAGTYVGIIVPLKTYTHTNCGYVTATITSNLAYSAKVLVGGQTRSFSGVLDTNGFDTGLMPGGGHLRFSLHPPDFWCDLFDSSAQSLASDTNAMSGYAAWVGIGDCYPTYFSKTNPATGYAGAYTIAIPPAVNDSRSTNQIGDATNGYGYGTVTISSNGLVTFVGATADGQVAAQSVPLSQDGRWPLFVPLYPLSKTNSGGELSGWINFYSTSGGASLPPEGRVLWIKSQNPAGSTNYASGLTNVSTILSSRFSPPTGAAPQVLTNFVLGTATFSGGGMTNSVSSWVFMDTSGLVYCYNPDLTLKINKTGLLSGKFPYNNNPAAKIAFSGVVMQNTTNAFGTFSGGGVSGTLTIDNYPMR